MSIFTMGIDVGSTASKCIILKDGKEIQRVMEETL